MTITIRFTPIVKREEDALIVIVKALAPASEFFAQKENGAYVVGVNNEFTVIFESTPGGLDAQISYRYNNFDSIFALEGLALYLNWRWGRK
jgi:hypothetical protein